MHQLTRLTVTIAAAAAALATTAVPAQAAVEKVRDGDDSPIAADIRHVRVVHDDTLRVRIAADDLKRNDRRVQGATVYIDTRRARRGPERMVEMGLWKGADHVVTRARRWHRSGIQECASSLRVGYERDWAVLELGPDCLGGAQRRARAAVVTYERTAERPYTASDWLTARRTFTPWVRRG